MKKNISGIVFGRLTVKNTQIVKNKKTYWLCKCDCGKEKFIMACSLLGGKTLSCGCYRNDRLKEIGKHNLSKSKIYKIHYAMKRRCYDNKTNNYKNYGGRGITICDEWLDKENGFICFYNWAMANGYKENLSIDRIDVNGNYEPNNCRWATKQEQNMNTRRSKKITYLGKTLTITEWSKIIGVSRYTLYSRFNTNKTVEEILKTN